LVKDSDREAGYNMILDGILNPDQFWDRPWESQAHYFDMYMGIIPEGHSVHIVDPYELLFNNSDSTATELGKLTDYLGFKYPSSWLNKINTYRLKNRSLINNTK
jgi:hypothetical protein